MKSKLGACFEIPCKYLKTKATKLVISLPKLIVTLLKQTESCNYIIRKYELNSNIRCYSKISLLLPNSFFFSKSFFWTYITFRKNALRLKFVNFGTIPPYSIILTIDSILAVLESISILTLIFRKILLQRH